MRNVISTVTSIDVSEEYSDHVLELLNGSDRVRTPVEVLRKTYQSNKHGQRDYCTRLVSYPALDSDATIYAVDDEDPDTHEVEETADLAEATARYEEVVRDRNTGAATILDDEDNEALLDYCDVKGVPVKENPTDG